MSAIFTKKDPSDDEYVLKYSLIYLGMRKIKDESITKILNDEANK